MIFPFQKIACAAPVLEFLDEASPERAGELRPPGGMSDEIPDVAQGFAERTREGTEEGRRGVVNPCVRKSFAVKTAGKFGQGVVVGVLDEGVCRIPDADRAAVRPFDVLRITEGFVEGIFKQVVTERGGGGEREEELPVRGNGTVAERALVVLADELLRVGARQLICVDRIGCAVSEWFREVFEPDFVEGDGVRIVEDNDVSGSCLNHPVERASGEIGAIGTRHDAHTGSGGDDFRGSVGGRVIAAENLEFKRGFLCGDGCESLLNETAVVMGPDKNGDGCGHFSLLLPRKTAVRRRRYRRFRRRGTPLLFRK